MYSDPEGFYFMDQDNYETISIPTDQVGDSQYYLKKDKIPLLYYKGMAISIDLPNFVELVVTQTDPGLKVTLLQVE